MIKHIYNVFPISARHVVEHIQVVAKQSLDNSCVKLAGMYGDAGGVS